MSTLARVLFSDVVVWADTFVFNKQTTMNRMRIKTVTGKEWLTVPVSQRGKTRQLLSVEIDNDHHWRHNHSKSLQVNYMNSPYYNFLQPELDATIQKDWVYLVSLTCSTLDFLCEKMRIPVRLVKGSECPEVADRSQRVCEWLKTTGCRDYLVNKTQLHLIDLEHIHRRGFTVSAFQFSPAIYPQVFDGFYPDLSGLDLLFNTGEQSRSVLKQSSQIVPVHD